METIWALLLTGAKAFVTVVGFTASAIAALAVLVLLWNSFLPFSAFPMIFNKGGRSPWFA